MGINGLLPFIKNSTLITSLSQTGIDNSTAGIDVSLWIHKAVYACPEILYHRTQMQHAYTMINNYIDNYISLLESHGVKMTIVFDGMRLPAKKVTHQERAEKKAEARRMVEKCLAAGNKSEARKYMISCNDITFDIVESLIKYCKKKHIDYIVAPYEADAQLAFLNMKGLCEYIITEDTDLIVYGCSKVIYKLDTSGKCLFYQKARLYKSLGPKGDKVSFEKFRRICILSGCDYLKNIPSIGLQSAKKFFLMTRQDDLRLLLPKLPVHLNAARLSGKVTKEYIESFIKAESTFKHQIVYDPRTKRVRPLESYPKNQSWQDFSLAGKPFHRVMAEEMVKGNIDLDQVNVADLDSESGSDSDTDSESHDSGSSKQGGDSL